MKTFRSIVVAILGVTFLALSLISCHRSPVAQTYAVSGFTVTPRLESNDEFVNAIGAWEWRFDISSNQGLKCTYEVQEDGKPPVAFGGMGLVSDKTDKSRIETTMMIGMIPLGKTLSEADQIKLVTRSGGGMTTSFEPNPFRGARVIVNDPPTLQADGAWRLLRVTTLAPRTASDPVTSRNLTLVCRLTPWSRARR